MGVLLALVLALLGCGRAGAPPPAWPGYEVRSPGIGFATICWRAGCIDYIPPNY